VFSFNKELQIILNNVHCQQPVQRLPFVCTVGKYYARCTAAIAPNYRQLASPVCALLDCFTDPLNSAAILKIDKTSLLRRGWPDFSAIWQVDAE